MASLFTLILTVPSMALALASASAHAPSSSDAGCATLIRAASLAFPLTLSSACVGDESPGVPLSSFAESAESPAMAAPIAGPTTLYAHSAIHIRSQPARTASIVRTLRVGESVLVADPVDGWSAVLQNGGTTGYVSRATDALRASRPLAVQQLMPSGGSTGHSSRRSSNSRVYHTGPRGGCYTYTSSGNKRYVDHSYCNP